MRKIIAPVAITTAELPMLACILILCACFVQTGCVSGNKAEVSAIRIEKQSTASEVDQYVTTAGKVFRFFGVKPDAERK